jgi:RsiW-degrading membrane proteinase PrsW (M82 family)
MSILLGILLAIVASLAPALIYGVILWWFDRYEKEPTALLVAAFLWGAVPAIILSLIFQILLDIPISEFTDPASASLIGASVVAPITEETFKAGALALLLLFFRKEIDRPGWVSPPWRTSCTWVPHPSKRAWEASQRWACCVS